MEVNGESVVGSTHESVLATLWDQTAIDLTLHRQLKYVPVKYEPGLRRALEAEGDPTRLQLQVRARGQADPAGGPGNDDTEDREVIVDGPNGSGESVSSDGSQGWRVLAARQEAQGQAKFTAQNGLHAMITAKNEQREEGEEEDGVQSERDNLDISGYVQNWNIDVAQLDIDPEANIAANQHQHDAALDQRPAAGASSDPAPTGLPSATAIFRAIASGSVATPFERAGYSSGATNPASSKLSWGHMVDVPEEGRKAAIKAWATVQLRRPNSSGADTESFGPEDNGKFIVRIHDEERGRYNLCLVFRERMTVHGIRIDPEGVKTNINKKDYGGFRTLDELVAGLATDPPAAGWPQRLTYGVDAATSKLVPTTWVETDEDGADEAGNALRGTKASGDQDSDQDVTATGDHFTVELVKDELGYGLTFGGAKTVQEGEDKGYGIFVTGTKPGSVAAGHSEIVPGLQVVALNGDDMSDATFPDLKQALRTSPDKLSIEFGSNPQLLEAYRGAGAPRPMVWEQNAAESARPKSYMEQMIEVGESVGDATSSDLLQGFD